MARTYQDNAWRWVYCTEDRLTSLHTRLVVLAGFIFIATWIGAALIANTQGFRNSQAILERKVTTISQILATSHQIDLSAVAANDNQYGMLVWEKGVLLDSIGPLVLEKPNENTLFSHTFDNEIWFFSQSCVNERCVVYGAPHQRRHQNLYCLAASIFGPLFLILFCGFILMLLAISFALKPLNEFALKVSKLNFTSPKPLTTSGAQREFKPLILAINDLGHRVQTLLDRERMFMGSCAHEIRTPLAGLIGQLQLAGNNERLKNAKDCAARTVRVAEQFLDFATSKNLHAADCGQENFDLCEVVRDIIAPFASDSDAIIEMIGKTELEVHAHIFALSAVASNLIQNALKYGKREGLDQVVVINVDCLCDVATLVIEDNGNGLDENQIALAMQQFTRLHNVSKHSGAGLGLCIVREIVHQYNGSITFCRSSSLGGLKVEVFLPIIKKGS